MLARWEQAVLMAFALMVTAVTGYAYGQSEQAKKPVPQEEYWDAYGCHTDGLTYNATADRLDELPWPCKEYHRFTTRSK